MMLRISINANRIVGPYGGGNQFANSLEDYLRARGYQVTRSLIPGLDLILMASFKRHPRTTSYDVEAVRDYVMLNHNTGIVHRVSSWDEQRGRDLGFNEAMLRANRLADQTVFTSSYVRDLFADKGMDLNKPHTVILNGADEELFRPDGRADWRPGQKLRIVTHHWSSSHLKGFDVYERLDQLLATEPFKHLFEFTFVGNVPLGVEFTNTRVVAPTWGKDLADLLRQQHLYVTARSEAAGMHHVEGMRCGLPVLFLDSGALPEYCGPFGIEFTLADFEQKLLEMPDRYPEFREKVLSCPLTGTRMAAQYEQVFLQLVDRRRRFPFPKASLGKKVKVRLIARLRRMARRLCQLWSNLRRETRWFLLV